VDCATGYYYAAFTYDRMGNYSDPVAMPMPAGLQAAFTTGPLPVQCPYEVSFVDTSGASNISTWLWDFGDGNTSTEQNPVHTYTRWGSYNVTLALSAASGPCPVSQVIAVGCPIPGDLDRDGDVDMTDFGHFQRCLTGPGMPQSNPDCLDAKLDADQDVDREDLAILQSCLSGANVPSPCG
jgi:hypothetical protein